MSSYTEDMPAHPLAELFPMGSEDDLKTLSKSIKEIGLQEPVVVHEGMVLDGRRRQAACRMAKVQPTYVDWDGECESPTVFVITKNLHRRHLTVAERAMVALEAKKWLAKEAEERQKASQAKPGQKVGGKNTRKAEDWSPQPRKPQARDEAGKLAGVSGKTVNRAEKVMKQGTPELQQAMKTGKVPIATAAKIAEKTADEQIAELEKAESAPRRTGVDEDKRQEQEPRSVRKWLKQHIELGRTKEQAHARIDELWDSVMAEAFGKRRR